MMINTGADLEALRGTEEWPVALRMLAGTTVGWRNISAEGAAPIWEQEEDLSALARLGLSKEWLITELAAAGIVIDPPVLPIAISDVPDKMFLTRDLLALLTDSDFASIETVKASNISFRRLWDSMLGQGDAPIHVTAGRFLEGAAGLKAALGDARTAEIFGQLGISN